MRAVDTNVLVRLITRDDPKQFAAAERFVQPGAWVSQLALVEATWVLATTYGRSPAQIVAAVQVLLDLPTLSLQDPEVIGAALRHFRERPSLGFSDCLLLEIARKAGHLPLGTFDRALSRLPDVERLHRA